MTLIRQFELASLLLENINTIQAALTVQLHRLKKDRDSRVLMEAEGGTYLFFMAKLNEEIATIEKLLKVEIIEHLKREIDSH